MAETTLYRKYRPKKFSELIGQEIITKSLINSIQNDSISHAYIFSGTRGTGKTSIAKIVAKAINCLDFKKDVCLKCDNCNLIAKSQTIDIVELDAASNNGVEHIRTITDSAQYLPQNLKYKVYIIDEAHMLSNSAWNALLKTIEEPPKHCIFIFATTEFHKIPLTIISRCIRYQFNRLSIDNLKQLLKHVSDCEKIKISLEAIEKIAYLSDGAARDALTILEQLISFCFEEITEKDIIKVFGLFDNSIIIDFVNHFLNNNYHDVFDIMKKVSIFDNHSYLIDMLSNYCLDLLTYLMTNDTNLLYFLTTTEINKIQNISIEKIKLLLNVLNQTLKDAKFNGKYWFYFKLNLSTILGDFPQQKIVKKEIGKEKELNIKQETNNEQENVFKNQEVIKNDFADILSKDLNIKDFYQLNQIDMNPKPKIDKKEVNQNQIYDLFEKTIFYVSKNKIKIVNEKLNNIKMNYHTESILKLISNATKVELVSKNLVFLSFETSLYANQFNDLLVLDKNIEILKKAFEEDLYFIGIDKNRYNEYLSLAKESKKNKKEVIQITQKDILNHFNIDDEDDIINDIRNL